MIRKDIVWEIDGGNTNNEPEWIKLDKDSPQEMFELFFGDSANKMRELLKNSPDKAGWYEVKA